MLARILSLIVVATLASCSVPQAVRMENCLPPPAPECKPGIFGETLIDTTFPGQNGIYQQIKVLPAHLNTEANDFAIASLRIGSSMHALVTSDRVSTESASSQTGPQQLHLSNFVHSGFATVREQATLTEPFPYGSAFFSESDGVLYFSGKAANSDPNDYDLYVGKPQLTNGQLTLTDVRPLTSVNERTYFDSHPTLTRDGKTLYFASDRRGGQGGVDIWYSTRISGDDWTRPQPLGTTINTLCDEITPFINNSGILIFASNGHRTVGGYDLFQARPVASGFDIAQNVGKPLNTRYDEFFPFAATDSTFYYASSQPASFAGVNLLVLQSSSRGGRILAERPRTREDSLREEQIDREREQLYQAPATVHGQITRGTDRQPAVGAEVFVRENATQQEIERQKPGPEGEFSFKLEKGKVYDIGAATEETFYAIKTLDLRRSLDTNIVLELNLPDT
ncbi:MAG TPA: hypothetical protein VFH43_06970, partial [Candidatus Kapabacteria bacterium]|nr:hypothetical protein [Candidatus Kapabacteria bacterium]